MAFTIEQEGTVKKVHSHWQFCVAIQMQHCVTIPEYHTTNTQGSNTIPVEENMFSDH